MEAPIGYREGADFRLSSRRRLSEIRARQLSQKPHIVASSDWVSDVRTSQAARWGPVDQAICGAQTNSAALSGLGARPEQLGSIYPILGDETNNSLGCASSEDPCRPSIEPQVRPRKRRSLSDREPNCDELIATYSPRTRIKRPPDCGSTCVNHDSVIRTFLDQPWPRGRKRRASTRLNSRCGRSARSEDCRAMMSHPS